MSSTQPPPSEGSGSYGGDSGYGGDPGYGGQPGFSEMPQYPSAPQVPYGGDVQQQNVPKPGSVRNAVRLMLVGAALSLVSIIVGIIAVQTLKGSAQGQMGSDASDNVANSVASVGAIGGVVFYGVVAAVLWLWMAWKTGQGRHWARIVSTVFAGLNLIRTAMVVLGNVAAGTSAGIGEIIVQVISLIVGIVVIVLLWRKDSGEFFAANHPQYG